jgi:hypothetical protein
VVARRQLIEIGVTASEIRRLLRRRELMWLHAGVYVHHTGPLTRAQCEWLAVLACWPAALSHQSALPGGSDGPVHVAIDMRRTVTPPTGVVVHRMAGFHDRVRWSASPPAVRLEHAAIEVARQQQDVAAMFRVMADAVQCRRTTVEKLRAALRSRSRVPNRGLLMELLDDLATGAAPVLEREYLALERRHGLPTGCPPVARQRPVDDGPRLRYQDVRYEELGMVVELDGRAFHDNAEARDADAGRDLDHAVSTDGLTVRLTYGQVFRDGCATVAKIAILLQRRGWTGELSRCPNCPDSP